MTNTNYTVIATNLQTGTESGRLTVRTMKEALALVRRASKAARGTRGYEIRRA